MRKISAVTLLGVGVLSGLWLMRPLPANADALLVGSPGQVVGSWLADIDILGDPTLAAQALLNFTVGGGLTIVDTTDMGGHPISGGLDSVGYGAWVNDDGQIRLRYVVFNFDDFGTPSGYTRITDVLALDAPDFNTGAGTYSIESFELDEDPLGPPKAPDIAGTFTVRRITVE